MNWLGKAFGSVFGFLVGGPVGAAVGAAFGHKLDHRDDGSLRRIDNQVSTAAHAAFFNATFAVMGHVAKSDGRVSEADIRMASEIMDRMLLSPEQRRVAMQRYGEGKQSGFALDATLDAFRRECRTRYTLMRLFIEIQLECAWCEGEPHESQDRLLLYICKKIRFSQFEYHAIRLRRQSEVKLKQEQAQEQQQKQQGRQQRQTFNKQGFEQAYRRARQQQEQWRSHNGSPPPGRRSQHVLDDAYKILGVTARAGDDEVKRAYRRLMSQNHPDKLAARGASEAAMRKANERTQQIRKAYDRIAQARKIS